MDVLNLTLQAAVPLRILELLAMPAWQRAEAVQHWAADAVEVVASNGDTLMFKAKPHKLTDAQVGPSSRRRVGDEVSTATTFNHLARGLAALAMAPGGVRFLGTHWCAASHPGGTSDTTCRASGE
jgi:hypothetical protein